MPALYLIFVLFYLYKIFMIFIFFLSLSLFFSQIIKYFVTCKILCFGKNLNTISYILILLLFRNKNFYWYAKRVYVFRYVCENLQENFFSSMFPDPSNYFLRIFQKSKFGTIHYWIIVSAMFAKCKFKHFATPNMSSYLFRWS